MIFARLSKNQTSYSNIKFKDVKPSDWFYNAVKIGAEQGFINGYTDKTFKPDSPITRAEFASVISTYARKEASKQTFFDVNGWATDAINTAFVNGWMQGYNNEFRPDDLLTRAEAVTVINRMLNRNPDKEFINNQLLLSMSNSLFFTDIKSNDWYFYDVYGASWGHDYIIENGTEKWTRLNGKAFNIN